jgi:hypothetical protein
MKQTFQIATPSLAQFTEEIVRMCKDGWELDNENVAHTAHNYGNLYAVILVKQDTNTPEIAPDVLADALERELQPKRVPPRRKQQEEK